MQDKASPDHGGKPAKLSLLRDLQYDGDAGKKPAVHINTAEAYRVPPPFKKRDNATLVEECRQGNEAAWRALVERYENLVYSVALDCGLDQDQAGDVFQLVWLEVYRSLDRIRNPQALPRWLMVSTRRLCYKQVAGSSKRVSEVSQDMVDPTALPDEVIADFENHAALYRALDKLGEPGATLIRLLFLSQKKISYEEISKQTGLAIGSIGPIRARYLARLRKLMESEL